MFGYVKKEAVVNMITDEMKMNDRLALKYDTLGKSLRNEGATSEADRYAEYANNYFSRYMVCKELLAELEKL